MKEKAKGSHNDRPNTNTAKVMVFAETAKFCTCNFYFARVFARVYLNNSHFSLSIGQ